MGSRATAPFSETAAIHAGDTAQICLIKVRHGRVAVQSYIFRACSGSLSHLSLHSMGGVVVSRLPLDSTVHF